MKQEHRSSEQLILLFLCGMLVMAVVIFFAINIKRYAFHTESPKSHDLDNSAASQQLTLDLTARQFTRRIHAGWNLGNSLDSCVNTGRNDGTINPSYYETAWGNPVTTKEMIDTIAASGFDTIRIPVTWFYNTYKTETGKLCIQEAWLHRVEEVVNYALDNDMYVILNSHHDSDIIWADMNDIEEVSDNLSGLWTQIALYFQSYDEHLLFEGFNEINTKDNSWQYHEGAANATNILNQVFVDSVRNTGGNNLSRLLICSTYLADYDEDILNAFVLPDDTIADRLIIDVHSYDTAYNQDIDRIFTSLKNFSDKINAPVIIGEFGSADSFNPAEYRASHAGNFIARANDYGIKCFWWDNGSSNMLLDRTQNTFPYPDIVDAIMNPKKFTTDNLAKYAFHSIDDFTYASIDAASGSLEASEQGALTLTLNANGLSVASSLGYRIVLTNKSPGDGMRLSGIAFYDKDSQFISYTNAGLQTDYDITAPTNAHYMKVTFYNAWGYRDLAQYESYLDSNCLYLEITEYKKT